MAKQLALIPAVSVGSEEAYVQAVSSLPLLSVEEEQQLAERYQLQQDLDAARRLVMSHLRFVVHVARSYKGYGLPLGDLIQEGNIGLMKAVKRFDPAQNVRLVSFAVHWIRAEIHEFILRNWRIVRVATTKAQRKLFFNLRSAKKRLGWLNQSEINAVAKDLGVKPETVVEMESRMSGHDVAFDASPDEEQDDEAWHPVHYLAADAHADPAKALERDDWETQQGSRLQNALASLDARSRDIIQQRWMSDEKATLEDLAATYNVSAERIRQLEKTAMGKLQNAMLTA